jgi:hypothetical protein
MRDAPPTRGPRLVLLTFDELCVLWDALARHRLFFEDPGDYDLEISQQLQERLGDLMADEYEKQE